MSPLARYYGKHDKRKYRGDFCKIVWHAARLLVWDAVFIVAAVGVLVGSLMGAAAGMADEMIDAKEGSAHK